MTKFIMMGQMAIIYLLYCAKRTGLEYTWDLEKVEIVIRKVRKQVFPTLKIVGCRVDVAQSW